MLEIIKTTKAKNDLKEIWHYTFKTWGIEQADKYLLDLENRIKSLEQNPKIGSIYDYREGYRTLPVKSHLVFYRLKINEIQIIRVLHKRIDPDQNL